VIDVGAEVHTPVRIPVPRQEARAPHVVRREDERGPAPRRPGRLGWATAGAAVLALGYLPAARVPIIADDLQALQEIYAISDGNLWRAVAHGLSEGQEAGHFNPIGQALGAAYHFTMYAVSAAAGISPQYADVLAYLAMIWLTVTGATSLLVWGLRRSGTGGPDFWPLSALVATITAVTLQLHTPWSNDPVVSYGPAGWGSAALGFWTIALALRATSPGATDRRSLIGCSLLAVTCVWYYEMLVAAVAATAVGLALTAVRTADPTLRRRCALLLGTAVGLPAVLFLVGRHLAASSERSYGGTTMELGAAAARTWATGMSSAVPGGGWKYLIDMAGAPVVRGTGLLLGIVLCALAGAVGAAWFRSTARSAGGRPGAADRGTVLGVGAVVVTYWALATATHSVTDKYAAEIRYPGQVYLFYAVGVVAVALLLALGLMTLLRRAPRALLAALLPLAGLFVLVQVTVNMQVADVARAVVPHNGPLVALSTDGDAVPATRCAVLRAWLAQGWPEYYGTAVTEHVQENYEREFGEPFCPPDA
jgi:hypothetical protein